MTEPSRRRATLPEEHESLLALCTTVARTEGWEVGARHVAEEAARRTGSPRAAIIAIVDDKELHWLVEHRVGATPEPLVDSGRPAVDARPSGPRPVPLDSATAADGDLPVWPRVTPVTDCILDNVISHGVPRFSDLRVPQARTPPLFSPWDDLAPRHYAAVPLQGDDGVVGVLVVLDSEHDYRGSDLRTLARLADLASLVCERYRSAARMEELEAQLFRSRQLESIGRLACRVAHDFNNLLTAITGHSNLLSGQLEEGTVSWRHTEDIRRAADRAALLVQQLLNFSRRQLPRPRVLDLGALVRDLENTFRALLGEQVTIHLQVESELWPVKGDPAQLEHALVNLAVNARDAMPSGGAFHVSAANTVVEGNAGALAPGLGPGRYVVVTVSDTGCGMDRETRARIFEPFYTTKEPGRGTGLGLVNVLSIVQQCGGRIAVHSEPGLGTTFQIYLPTTDAMPEPEVRRGDAPASHGMRETVMIVDDEEMVRELVAEILADAGYTVFAAKGVDAALQLASDLGGRLHLLITDLQLPQMNGTELADTMMESRPEMRALYISGYDEPERAGAGLTASEEGAFLMKPFTPKALLAKVREVLSR